MIKETTVAKYLLLGKTCDKCVNCEFLDIDDDTPVEWTKYKLYNNKDLSVLNCILTGKHPTQICYKYRERYNGSA